MEQRYEVQSLEESFPLLNNPDKSLSRIMETNQKIKES